MSEPNLYELLEQFEEKLEIETAGLKVLTEELNKISESLLRITERIRENNENPTA
jgi:hypothetical protein